VDDPGLPYDEFVKLVFVDFKDNTNDSKLGERATRIQFLKNRNEGKTVENLRRLPSRSLKSRKIIDRVKQTVRHKIIERRGSSLSQVFRSFDINKDGQVSLAEMEEQIHKLLGNTVTSIEIEMLLTDLDVDGDGTINLREFSNLLGDKELGGKGTSITTQVNRNIQRPSTARSSRRITESTRTDESTSGRRTSRSSHERLVVTSNEKDGHGVRPSSAPMGGKLRHRPTGTSPSRQDLKADRGAARRNQSKMYCLPPRGNVRELTFPFKELYTQKKIPSKWAHTPYHDTSELIVTARQKMMTAGQESIGRASLAVSSKDGSSRRRANIRSAVGFNFNHQDRERHTSVHEAKLSRLRKYNDRIENNVVEPSRFAATEKSNKRVHTLIRQRLDYYGKLQARFERDRAMQLAAGV